MAATTPQTLRLESQPEMGSHRDGLQLQPRRARLLHDRPCGMNSAVKF